MAWNRICIENRAEMIFSLSPELTLTLELEYLVL